MYGINTLYIPTLASGQMWSMTRSKVAHYLAESILAATETRACMPGWMLLDNSEGGALREGRLMVEGRFTLVHGLRKFDLNDDNQLIYTTLHRGCTSLLKGGVIVGGVVVGNSSQYLFDKYLVVRKSLMLWHCFMRPDIG